MTKFIYLNLFALLLLSACNKTQTLNESKNTDSPSSQKKVEQTKSYYTCSMHPHIKEHKPGKCPICNMRLTKVTQGQGHSAKQKINQNQQEQSSLNANTAGQVRLRKDQLKHFKAAIFTVKKMLMKKKIYLLGSIIQSEETESKITARISGRVEKVYITSTGSLIKKSSPIVDLYSPKLITAGEEYLIARRSYKKNKSIEFKNMLKQSTQRLKLWGVKSFQYNRWFAKSRVPKKITIYSPSTGIVRKSNARVGKYFKEGQIFFELSDLSDVWIEMDVYEHEASLVEIGQKVQLQFTALPGESIESAVDFINPVLNSTSRTLKIRATVNNSTGKLKPGMVAKATLNIIQKEEVMVVPKTAVIDTGKRKVIWIKISTQVYQAKVIKTGYESGGFVEIKQGLNLGDKVVTEGNFLLDAQAQLFGGYGDDKNSETIPSSQKHH